MYLLWLVSYLISLAQTMRLHGCRCNNGVVLRNEDDTWLSHLVWVVVMQRRWKVGLSIGGLGKREDEGRNGYMQYFICTVHKLSSATVRIVS